jgi:acetylornithine deacetylase/succinyl-diaminopimelate desuccinylase-like protein
MTPLGDDLAALVAIASVRGDRPALAAAAGWLAARLRGLGAQRVAVRWAAGSPVVLARRHTSPGAPTVLAYGHFDVVPPGPRRAWSSPPFGALRRGTVLIGRGAADDKGPLLAQLRAAGASPQVNWRFVYDGGEESGSPGLATLVRRRPGWFAGVDAILVCDTEATEDGRPTLTCSLRGQLSVELTARAGGRPLHPGRYGGAVPDPARALARLVASLHRPDGSVAIRGFTAAARPMGTLGAAELERRLAAFAHPGWGQPGTAAEQVTVLPAIVVTALRAGDGHAIPADASATIDVRLVPGQSPATAAAQLAAHLGRHTPPGITLGLRRGSATEPWAATGTGGPAVRAATRAVREVWGRPPALVRSGGTVSAVPLLAGAAPRAEVVLLGCTLPGDGAHAPDEHTDLVRLRATARTLTRLVRHYARSATTG